ncbi:related to conserved hypothetical Ustilaginaceae-specific protein [Ustilago trichophora]|uniref:Related to conserved hypothetical Ustilaginaceae-specific protein n=1 Tax=Ustilago trichophora TaxID=86804 RepID=A0A5C3EHQ3_9BASI|nr:related to conserved hypothetical Ustilaginaceae-specific protein [Ustilago trichophora]
MASLPSSHQFSSGSTSSSKTQLTKLQIQIDELLPSSLGDNQIISTSSPLARDVSTLLHDRLTTQFEPTKWPLDRVYDFLKSFFDSHPDLHPCQIRSAAVNKEEAVKEEDDDKSKVDVAAPTTPVTPTSALPQLPSQQALNNTPRTAKAAAHLTQLRLAECWSPLVGAHDNVCGLHKLQGTWADSALAALAQALTFCQPELCTIMPELIDVLSAKTTLVGSLATIYDNLAARFPTFNQSDEALALILVHLAQSYVKRSRDPESFGTNIHLAHEFQRPYRGNAPNRFLTFVSHLDDAFDKLSTNDPKPYYCGTPIVQSSGTGKMRMVYKCQQLTPLLYVCFRKRSANGNAKAGYPLPDQGVRSYFENAQRTHPYLCDLQVACFLAAWFTKLAQALKPLETDAQKYQHLCHLNRFEPPVLGNNPSDPSGRHPRNKHFKAISELAETYITTTYAPMQLAHHEKIFDAVLRQPLLDLNKQLTAVSRHLHSGRAGVPVPPVLVAFDECIEMIVTELNTANNQLNSLRRAWNYIGTIQDEQKTLSFWLVLMSTSSSAAHLVEHIDAQSSLRRRNSVPLPTFVGVGFDVLAEEQHALSCASQASSVHHLVRYGRPLWPSLEKSHFWDNVLVKLQGSETFAEDNAAQCFSVMASRLALGLVPVHADSGALFGEQKLFMDKTVDRHMRMVSRISNHATMYVDSPSEPVLAIAASLIMLPTTRQDRLHPLGTWQKAVNTYGSILENFRRQCLVAPAIAGFKGMHGELASRMALIVAWDAAKRKQLDALELQRTSEYVTVLTRAVPLEAILAGLADLDEANLDRLRHRIEKVQQDGSSTRWALQSPPAGAFAASSTMAWTNFTHFDVLPEHITKISPEYLWYCWKRGVGLQMAHSQHGIDGIIPVFMGNLDRPFVAPNGTHGTRDVDDADTDIEMHAARYMTYVAWEAKNTNEPQPGAGSGKTDLMLKLAGPSIMRASHAPPNEKPLTERALMGILLDLGTSTPFATKPRGFRPQVQMINGTECPRLCIRGVADTHAYPCFDVLQIRPVFEQLLTELANLPSFEQFNALPNQIWNDCVQPALPSILATRASSNPPPPPPAAAADHNDGDRREPQG